MSFEILYAELKSKLDEINVILMKMIIFQSEVKNELNKYNKNLAFIKTAKVINLTEYTKILTNIANITEAIKKNTQEISQAQNAKSKLNTEIAQLEKVLKVRTQVTEAKILPFKRKNNDNPEGTIPKPPQPAGLD